MWISGIFIREWRHTQVLCSRENSPGSQLAQGDLEGFSSLLGERVGPVGQ